MSRELPPPIALLGLVASFVFFILVPPYASCVDMLLSPVYMEPYMLRIDVML